jgi:glycosyltransferase involved in cell wall biosynthesis
MIARPKDIVRTLGISRCMLHVKESEGYGWSILEAIACGIPVISVEKYVKGKTCEGFLINNKTAILLKQDASEFRTAFSNTDLLRKISEEGPKFIREFINLEEQAAKLKDFLENVVL